MAQGGRRKATGRTRTTWFWRSALVNVGAVLGAFCLLFAGLIALFGVTPIVFRSDSMAPAISSGDLAIARSVSAGDVGVGDVVSVANRQGDRVTHRITAVEPYGSSIRVTLQADASAAPDVEAYDVTRVDKVLFRVPFLGRVVDTLSRPVVLVLGGVFVSCLAFVVFIPSSRIRGSRRSNGDVSGD
jgi:signal peptidase